MAKVKELDKIGHFLFLIGIIVAVLGGLVIAENTMLTLVLVLIGIIVGLLNITAKEATPFLVAAIALVVSAGALQVIPMIGTYLIEILKYIIALVGPAATIVALLQVYKLAKTK